MLINLKGRSVEIIHSEEQRNTRLKKNCKASETCGTTSRVTINIKWKSQSRERGAGKKSEELMAENFPDLMKNNKSTDIRNLMNPQKDKNKYYTQTH